MRVYDRKNECFTIMVDILKRLCIYLWGANCT